MDLPEGDRRQARARVTGARTRCRWARCARTRSHLRILETMDEELSPRGTFRRERAAASRARRAPAEGDAQDERQSRMPTAARCCTISSCPTSATMPSTFPRRARRTAEATRVMGAFLRDVMKLNCEAREFPALQPGREHFQPLAGRVRSDRPRLGRRDRPLRRPPRPRRPGDGGA